MKNSIWLVVATVCIGAIIISGGGLAQASGLPGATEGTIRQAKGAIQADGELKALQETSKALAKENQQLRQQIRQSVQGLSPEERAALKEESQAIKDSRESMRQQMESYKLQLQEYRAQIKEARAAKDQAMAAAAVAGMKTVLGQAIALQQQINSELLVIVSRF